MMSLQVFVGAALGTNVIATYTHTHCMRMGFDQSSQGLFVNTISPHATNSRKNYNAREFLKCGHKI